MRVLRLLFEKYFSLTPQEFLSSQSRLGILTVCGENDYFKWEDEV